MWRYAIPVVLFGVLGFFFYRGLYLDPARIPSPLIGKPAPEFSVPTLHDPNELLTNADLGGDVALLNVWGTWCYACREEHPYLLELARTSGVRIFGLDWNDSDRATSLAWLEQYGNPYVKTGYDPTGHVGIDWGVYGAPETFLVAADGEILYKHIAPMTPEVWQNEFVPKINEARKKRSAAPTSRNDAPAIQQAPASSSLAAPHAGATPSASDGRVAADAAAGGL
ncbi:MAG TPA: DsbE family thiol:disulfide interchange protein [Gammaproteobacteria bacterium]|nr:DsbE family thiol:disulfide interchange protein [Gammaproteobacteria bacterium]